MAKSHDVSSRMTKAALAASLRKFMEKRPLSKITVSDIVIDTGVNRKTFYYHFEDLYALLKWMLEQETIEVIKNYDLLMDYREVLQYLMNYVEKNQHILNCAYDGMGRDGLKRFFYDDIVGLITKAMESAENALNLKADPQYRSFLIEFYTEALSGMLLAGFRDKKTWDHETLISYVDALISATLPQAITAYPRNDKDEYRFIF